MTNISPRKMIDSPTTQAETESYAYELDTADWGCTAPTNPTCFVFVDDIDKSSQHLDGSASVVGTVITTKRVKLLKRNKLYRLVVEWDDSGNHLSAYCEIAGEKP